MYRVAREALQLSLEAVYGRAYAFGLGNTVGLAVRFERAEKKPTAAARSRQAGRLEGRREILVQIIQESIVGPHAELEARKLLQRHEAEYRQVLEEDEAWLRGAE
ncbi:MULTISPECIES: hypothetical protein [unclassified Streptomyces]|uniref:hypothetical protein n=1 Tax=unclassified Streptomyces TaxID=2593676 RepID=UPI00081DEB6A|nr:MULTISPECIES: hypothetical protein [unclassified Streptomyces]MYR95474.1 hypothetical protein [Streptomyces sp. SID4937]SCD91001.1 hypothetical protein GA0115243_104758 [Streptomyces sp. ScaeMP-e83]